MPTTKKGLFISLEGIDGSGKTTHAYLLKDSLSSQGFEVVMLDDEYTTRIGGGIRAIVSEHLVTRSLRRQACSSSLQRGHSSSQKSSVLPSRKERS